MDSAEEDVLAYMTLESVSGSSDNTIVTLPAMAA